MCTLRYNSLVQAENVPFPNAFGLANNNKREQGPFTVWFSVMSSKLDSDTLTPSSRRAPKNRGPDRWHIGVKKWFTITRQITFDKPWRIC